MRKAPGEKRDRIVANPRRPGQQAARGCDFSEHDFSGPRAISDRQMRTMSLASARKRTLGENRMRLRWCVIAMAMVLTVAACSGASVKDSSGGSNRGGEPAAPPRD